MNIKKEGNQEEVKNYYSCYGESDARCIREEERKRRWLSHKTKHIEMSYTDTATSSFQHEPNWGSLDYALGISEDKEFTKEILEVGILKGSLYLERLSDAIEREFPKMEKIVSELGNVRTQSGGVINPLLGGAELLSFNHERLKEKGESVLETSPLFDDSINLHSFKEKLDRYATSKKSLQEWRTALDVHAKKVA